MKYYRIKQKGKRSRIEEWKLETEKVKVSFNSFALGGYYMKEYTMVQNIF